MTDACRQFDALIARSARLNAQETAILDAHLAECGACRDLARVVKPLDADFKFTADTLLADGQPTTPTTPRDDTKTNDRYRITGEVGRGGIGRVLEALDQILDRPVALKELFSENDGLRRRFVREALITARLQHPSIVPIYDAGHLSDRSPFYAMKLVAGQPLDKSITEATGLAQRLALLPHVLAVADAMAYAHSKHIIHRDLKPSNILVGAFGETIVIDWGLAKDLAVDDDDALDAGPYRSASTEQTSAGAVLGTPAYMAPEQAAGEAVDERADVYALGAILYHVVAGATPHEGATFAEMVRRVSAGEVRPIADRTPEVPRDLAAIITKAMALAPSNRYANAAGLAEDLRRFLTGQLVGSHTYRARELVRRWIKRHRAAVTVALTALIFVGVVGVLSIKRVIDARERADQQRAIAEQEKTTATQTLATLLEEQGRQELLASRPTRAVAYLSEAYVQSHEPGVGLRTLLANAMQSVEAERLSLDGHNEGLTAAAFSPDGTRIVTAGEDQLVKVWDATAGHVVATLTGHTDRIQSASFSPDNTRIVTASIDETARIWDARTGSLLATLDHGSHVLSAAFSPDGARVVTAGADGVKLWAGTQLVASLAGHRNKVYSAAFSGTHLVTASADQTAKIWDDKGALVRSLDGHRDEVGSAAFSPDGSQIVTASDDHTARLWNAQTGTVIATLTGHTGPVSVATYNADGTRIVTASMDRSAKLWDARTGALLFSLDGHTAPLRSAAFSADGTRVVTASDDRTTKLWDALTGKQLASFEGHRDDIVSASFRPDGTQVLTASTDGTARLWNAMSSNARVAIDGKATRGALSADATKLVTTAAGDPTAKLWDARTGKLLASLEGHRADVTSAMFDPAGTHIITASLDHSAKLWDASTGKLLLSLDHPVAVQSAAFSSDGSRIVTSTGAQTVLIWNATTGAQIAKFDRTPEDYPVRLSKDGMRILTANMYGAASIKSVDTNKTIVDLEGSANPIYAAAFSLDGERVVTASVDRSVKVWNARTGKLLASLAGTTRYVFSGWFSADGARVITVSDDHTAKLWEAATGKLLASYDGHTDAIVDASFSPDGGRVLTISEDHTAKLWDERTGKLLASFAGHSDALLDGKFNADGTRVTTASYDGSIASWDVHLEQRKPDEIRRIVSARNPWTLQNGVLVPDRLKGNR